MLIDKYQFKPVYAPDTELGAPEPEVTLPPGGETETPESDGPGSGRSQLRQQLEKSFEDDRTVTARREKEAAKRAPKSRAREHLEAEGQVDPADRQAAEGTETPAGEENADPAPTAWAQDAKAAWADVPPAARAAIIKREQDVAKGVEELKAKVGRYNEMDKVLAPRSDQLRRHGHQPHEAVGQLFAWFDALSANPDVAFPALAASFRYDLRRILGQQQAQQQPQPGQQQTPPNGQAPEQQQAPEWQQHMVAMRQEMAKEMEQRVGVLQQQLQQQSQAKTDEMLERWSTNKPHFEAVRTLMGKIIIGLNQDNTVPLLPNGSVDLDQIYDMAIHANPEVRAKLLAEQQVAQEAARKQKLVAEQKAQTDQAAKARLAAGSLAPGAPGSPQTPKKGKPGGKSIRESLRDSIEELRQ